MVRFSSRARIIDPDRRFPHGVLAAVAFRMDGVFDGDQRRIFRSHSKRFVLSLEYSSIYAVRDDGGLRAAAFDEAAKAIRNSNLSTTTKQKALANLESKNFVTNTVGSGNARNSVQVRYCGGAACK